MPTATVKLNDGTHLPALAFGLVKSCSAYIWAECGPNVQHALEAGYVHIDCAQFYENLPSVPKGIKLTGRKRADVFIALKLGTFRGDREAFDGEVFLANALNELETDYVDLLMFHSGTCVPKDIIAAWRQLETAKKQGKARSIGVSNCTTRSLEAILAQCEIVPAVNQIEFSAYALPTYLPTLLPLCRKHNITITSYSALLSLTRHKGGPVDAAVRQVAAARGRNESEAQVLLLWAHQVSQGGVITSSPRPERMVELLQPFETDYTRLSAEDLKTITAVGASAPYRQWGSHWPYWMPGEGGIEACDPGLSYCDRPEPVVKYLERLGKT